MAREVSYEVIIDMPREKAWAIMQDITVPHKYVPGLIKTEMHGEKRSGVGASRRVFKRFMAMDETVTEWNEGYGFRIRLHDGAKDKPFPQSYFIYKIEDAPEGKTRFTATMGYSFPFGAIGQFIDTYIIAPIVTGEIRAVALAVKHYYETGITPTPADIKRLKQYA
jgi:hypothetical protein